MEEAERKPFRKAISKSDRKKFDQMMFWYYQTLHLSACSSQFIYKALYANYVNLLYCYEELSDCISQVDQRRAKVEGLQMAEDSTQSKLLDF